MSPGDITRVPAVAVINDQEVTDEEVKLLSTWPVVAKSNAAQKTTNPIRNVVDRLRVPPNPNLPLISLGLGDPTIFGNLRTPEPVAKAVIDVLISGKANGYPPATGLDTAKEAVAMRYTRPEAPLTPKDVIIASGCSGALEMSFSALASPGQSILLPQPGFSLYRTLCDNKDINVEYYRLRPEKEWEIDLDHVEELIKKGEGNIVAWLINNPSNPCGSVYGAEHLRECKALAAKYRLIIIADEIYEDMVFSPNVFHPLATIRPAIPMITCGGLAKRFLVPGWRLGWILLHDPTSGGHALEQIRGALVDLAGLILGANSLIQASLPAIFALPQEIHQETNDYIANNARIAYECLRGTRGLHLIRPQGAFYMMVGLEVESFDFKDDIVACEMLVAEESVVCLPGMIFGMPNYIRLVCCAPPEKIEEAAKRIRTFLNRHLKQSVD